MTDRELFLNQAEKYIGKNGAYVCLTKLNLGYITHWCAFSVSAIMKDCGFIGKYIKQVEGGAGSVPRAATKAPSGWAVARPVASGTRWWRSPKGRRNPLQPPAAGHLWPPRAMLGR